MSTTDETFASTPSLPFPHQAVHSLDTRPVLDVPSGLPTLVVPAVSALQDLTAVYLDRFQVPGAPRGQAVALRGEHGSGKTHAIGHLMRQVDCGEVSRGPGVADVQQLYAKIERADLPSVYRTFMPQISIDRMREIAARFIAQLAGESVVAAGVPDDPGALAELRSRLVEDPQLVEALVGTYAIDAGDIVRRRDEEIERVTGGTEDFRRAFPYLFTDLAEIAYDWLVGRAVDPAKLRGIGVTSAIDTHVMAKHGLQLLATVCRRGGTALILYVDQTEKLVLGPDRELMPEMAGLLHSLVETIPSEDAMIVVSGNEESWRRMPPDLRERFGYRVVEASPYELAESVALVALYLHPRPVAPVLRVIPEPELAPFTIDAVELLHAYSGGRPRPLLELCSLTWEGRKPGTPIGPAAVRNAAGRLGVAAPVPDRVLDHVRRAAYERGFVVRDVLEHGTPALFVSDHGDDRVLFMLGLSHHYYDEVVDARAYENTLRRLQDSAPHARAVVVGLGYESPEVRKALERAGVTLIPYASEQFVRRIADTLDEVGTVARKASEDETARQLAELRETLDQLRAEREEALRNLADNVATVSDAQAGERLAERWQKANADWVTERRRLVDQIAEARRQRRTSELEELERLRAQAETERRNRARLVWSVPALATVFALVSAYYAPASDFRSAVFGVMAFVIAFAFLFANVLVIARTRTIWVWRDAVWRDRLQRELAAQATSLEDLRRLAHRTAGLAPFRALLHHANPQFRFAAATSAGDGHMDRLVSALAGERSALVRRTFAQRIAQQYPDLAPVVEYFGTAEVPETVYLQEILCSRPMLDATHEDAPTVDRAAPADARERLLAALQTSHDIAPAARALAARAHPDVPDVGSLSDALAGALPFASRHALVGLPIETVRDAVRDVSPFDAPGLGTFDELAIIEDVDRAFLGLSHVLFLSELGLLIESS